MRAHSACPQALETSVRVPRCRLPEPHDAFINCDSDRPTWVVILNHEQSHTCKSTQSRGRLASRLLLAAILKERPGLTAGTRCRKEAICKRWLALLFASNVLEAQKSADLFAGSCPRPKRERPRKRRGSSRRNRSVDHCRRHLSFGCNK